MPSSTKQIVSARKAAANRQNAKKSTGPRTAHGKRTVGRNHFVHGFYATPDKKTREEMFALGDDPDQLAGFERDLRRAWRPTDEMQAMVVGDLAHIYYEKAHLRKALRLTRLAEQKEQEAAIERVDLVLKHEPAINDLDLQDLGYRGMEPCQTAYDESGRLLEYLCNLNALRNYPDPATEKGQELDKTFELLYGRHPHGIGKRIIDLFHLLAQYPRKADEPMEKTFPGQAGTLRLHLATSIEKERLAVMFEERTYQTQRAEEAAGGLGSEWLPGGDDWGKIQMQDARMDRMIDLKIRILVRLKRLRHTMPEEFDGDLGPMHGGDDGGNGHHRESAFRVGDSASEREPSDMQLSTEDSCDDAGPRNSGAAGAVSSPARAPQRTNPEPVGGSGLEIRDPDFMTQRQDPKLEPRTPKLGPPALRPGGEGQATNENGKKMSKNVVQSHQVADNNRAGQSFKATDWCLVRPAWPAAFSVGHPPEMEGRLIDVLTKWCADDLRRAAEN